MATPLAQLQTFAQRVHLVIKGRYLDDITDEDGILFIQQAVDWVNMYLDELELEQNADGKPMDWIWMRQMGATLGTAVEGASSISIDSSIDHLLTDEQRYVQVLQDGTPVSNWAVVTPEDISSQSDRITEDMVTNVNGTLVFSRAFRDTEDGGTIIGDIINTLPRLTYSQNGSVITPLNIKVLTTVKPQQLLILGVAKNATLPDIVQGGLSPSYLQRYQNLLNGAIARSNSSSVGDVAQRDDYGSIRGVGF